MPRIHTAPRLRTGTPRVLYFDIDGTLVQPTFGPAKPALADGRFEAAARAAGFDRLVCVSDGVLMARALAEHGLVDPQGHLLRLCAGTVQDEVWFRTHVDGVEDPLHRGRHIDASTDWFYVDDFAPKYLERAHGPAAARLALTSGRALDCSQDADGEQVLQWLHGLATDRASWSSRRRVS